MTLAIRKAALITGIRGQDGSYLAELLLAMGYKVTGTSHEFSGQISLPATKALVDVVQLDLADTRQVSELVASLRPDEIYNLAARSSSAQLFDDALATAEINGLAAVRFLEAIHHHSPATRYCQAASSEIFVGSDVSPQDEHTAIRPLNAYGAAKTYALNMVAACRTHYGVHASTAILFNHESPRRSEHHVTRKISRGVAMIAAGQADSLRLGSLESRRDWGFAGDYVRAMWLMQQQPVGREYVIATGETHSVREFCEFAFAHAGLDYRSFVELDEGSARRVEAVELRGNSTRAREQLGWQPELGFAGLVRMMVDADRQSLRDMQSQQI